MLWEATGWESLRSATAKQRNYVRGFWTAFVVWYPQEQKVSQPWSLSETSLSVQYQTLNRAQKPNSPEYYTAVLQCYTVELDLHVKADILSYKFVCQFFRLLFIQLILSYSFLWLWTEQENPLRSSQPSTRLYDGITDKKLRGLSPRANYIN
jgi:hypothetical protein